MNFQNSCMEADSRRHCIDDTICMGEVWTPPRFNSLEVHNLYQFGCQVHGDCGAFIKHHGEPCQKPSNEGMKLIIQVPHPPQEAAGALINTDKGTQESPQLKVLLIVEQRK